MSRPSGAYGACLQTCRLEGRDYKVMKRLSLFVTTIPLLREPTIKNLECRLNAQPLPDCDLSSMLAKRSFLNELFRQCRLYIQYIYMCGFYSGARYTAYQLLPIHPISHYKMADPSTPQWSVHRRLPRSPVSPRC